MEGVVIVVVFEVVEIIVCVQVEYVLCQLQKIEVVGQFIGGIVYDFNNILMVIFGNVEYVMLFSECVGEFGVMVSCVLDNVLKGVGCVVSLIQCLLVFVCCQLLYSQVVNFYECLLDMYDMLQCVLGELVQLEICSVKDIWCVEIDVSQLEVFVLNLVVNVCDVMLYGGWLVIEVDNSYFDYDYVVLFLDVMLGEYVMLWVCDNGYGMDVVMFVWVFEFFFIIKQVGCGIGLGLLMVYGFVKQFGGYVLIDLVEGGGISIIMMFLCLLLVLFFEVCILQIGLVGYLLCEEIILVIEDNDDVCVYMVDVLWLLGYWVLEVYDGFFVLWLLECFDIKVDLLFFDVVMFGMLGWELVCEVCECWLEVVVLFMLGYFCDYDQVGSQGWVVVLLLKLFICNDLVIVVCIVLEMGLY